MNAIKRWIVYHWFILPMYHEGALSNDSLQKFSVFVHRVGIKKYGKMGWIPLSRMISEKLDYLARGFRL